MANRHFIQTLTAAAVSALFAASLPMAAQAAGTYDKSATSATTTTAPTAATGTTGNTGATSNMGRTSNATLSSSDEKFIQEAARGGLAEVQLGQLAQQKAQSSEVKQFGERMVNDHTKANDKLKQVASQKSLNLPTDMDSSSKREYDKLQKLSGAQFDHEYMKTMVSDHEKDVKEFRKEAQSAKDPDVKGFASSTLPTLEDHLKAAKSTEAAAKNERQTSAKSS
jgi:putative membrane protein